MDLNNIKETALDLGVQLVQLENLIRGGYHEFVIEEQINLCVTNMALIAKEAGYSLVKKEPD